MSVTQRDGSQVERYEHDEQHNAKKVVIVGGLVGDVKLDANLKLDRVEKLLNEINQKEVIKIYTQETKVEKIEVPVIVKETVIEKIEIPTTIKEIEKVEIPVIVKETVIEKIEIPVVKEIKQSLEFPKIVLYALIGHIIISLGILIALIIK